MHVLLSCATPVCVAQPAIPNTHVHLSGPCIVGLKGSWACLSSLRMLLSPGSFLRTSLHGSRGIPSKLLIHVTPCSMSTCHASLPPWRWPYGHQVPRPLVALQQEPSVPSSHNLAPLHLPLLQPLTGPSPSSWLFIKLGISSPLFAENPPSEGSHPPMLISALFQDACFSLSSQEFTVHIGLFENMPSSSLCRLHTSPYPQLDCEGQLRRPGQSKGQAWS